MDDVSSILKGTKKIIETEINFRKFFIKTAHGTYGNEPSIGKGTLPPLIANYSESSRMTKNKTSSSLSYYKQKSFYNPSEILSLRTFYPMHIKTNTSYNSNALSCFKGDYLKKIKKKITINSSLERFNNDIFDNESYMHLKYDESEIFNQKEKISAIIKNRIKYFSKNENKNYSDKLIKTISNQKKEYKITFKSINVKFIDTATNKQSFEFALPFALLPIFYYKGIENFKVILSKIVHFNQQYNKITIEYIFLRKTFFRRHNKIT